MSIEVMKQALEALEYIYEGANNQGPHTGISWRNVSNKAEPIITALRQALAQADEPVAWESLLGAVARGWCYEENANKTMDIELALAIAKEVSALYTHPQPKAEQEPKREPLSLEQLREHWQVARVLDMTDAEIDFADYVLIARDVEALHGIKGGA